MLSMSKQTPPFADRPPLNLSDPLANPTAGRRCVAAMLKAGYSQSSAARKLDIAYTTLDKWITGVNEPDRENLKAVGKLTGYSVDDLLHGETPAPETVLNREERASVLRTLNATPDERSAFAEHEDSQHGRYADMTRPYVARFVLEYRAQRALGTGREEAISVAYESAVDADAKATLKSSGTSSSSPPAPVAKKRR